ncbi:nonsense-mediated mRNA decay factor SMG7 isoform X2 [Eucyclogobius newberryi]|uniref:nonsense-mediated mRNA decay factor SMG7 isoform X2 n=1 Tax=Eucyclogobius newberryi TaxID=166745 RepID=UPI003B5C8852
MNLCAQFLRQAEALKADMTDSKLGMAEVWTSRQALQDVYQKMLVTDLEYALDKKVEQDLWNHAFKNQITTLQSQAKNRANPNRSEVQANLSLFLEAASGFYTQMLQELCTVFHVDLPCRVRSSQLGILSSSRQSSSAIVTPQSSSCFYICQHCLVHLGDIARYRNQTSQAESYYRHAAQLVPSNGQPYNQLAILASSKGDHLTTIFYYCRSIAVKFPFPAASTNLQKALSKALESREEVKTKWSLSDFIKAFIKFHGHVYLSKSVDKLDALRDRLEEQFQRLMLQKAFNSQQLVHLTVINLFELHHLQELSDGEQNLDTEHQTSWTQLLSLFMSFLGVMCSRAILNQSESEEQLGECPLPAIKVSLDWLRLRPGVFLEAALHQRQHVWPWLVSLLNGFQPKEEDVSCSSVVPLPEEFELQGFLALRPALRTLDFTKGHQGAQRTRHQRLVCLGKWIADTQSLLMQCRVSEDGLLTFLTDLPELPIDEPQEKEVLQESSNSEPSQNDSGGSKSSMSVSKGPSVSFKENLKPREPSRDAPHSLQKEPMKEPMKERRDFKGSAAATKIDTKWDGRKKSEMKKSLHDKILDPSKQVKVQTEMRKTPVSEVKKSPVTPPQTTGSSSQFVSIHHQGAFPPLPSCTGFPTSAYMLTPPVPFHGLQGFFSPGPVSVPSHFLSQGPPQPNKSSHPPYTQQRSPPQGSPASVGQSQPPGPPSMSQQQTLQQPPQQQVTLGKSPPHLGLQQFLQEQSSPLWGQGSGPKLPQMPLSLKQQQQQSLFMSPEPSLKQFDPQPSMPVLEKKFPPNMSLPPERMWEYSNQTMLERLRREQEGPPGRALPFQDPKSSPLLPPDLLKTLAEFGEDEGLVFPKAPSLFQALASPLSSAPGSTLFSRMEPGVESMNPPPSLLQGFPMQLNQNSMFSQSCGKNLPPSSKPEAPLMPQEPSLYSLFETPWSPSLPASSDHSTPASQSPHSSNPSSLPSSPPSHNHNTQPFSNFGPIGPFDSRERRLVDCWKTDKKGPGSGFGLDYLPTAPSSESSWPQSSWPNQESPMEESTVLPDSLKSFWSSSLMHSGPSALEQLLLQQQKQKQQRTRGTMNPPH